MKQFSILIADDDEQVCRILQDLFRREGYVASAAKNGREAVKRISETYPDLVISDIKMPVMDGFELFTIMKKEYPFIKHIMMTSYDVDQYIKHIRKYNIGNILVKGSDFNLAEVAAYVRAILTGDIFGLERYFKRFTCQQLSIRSYEEAKNAYRLITKSYSEKKGLFLEVAIDELISNAIFHGVLQFTHLPRDQWLEDIRVPQESAVQVKWGSDEEKIGISIEDPKGNLKKHDVLKWLDTHHRSKENDEHGRGFLLVRNLIDRLIVNIDPGKRTECIIIQHFQRSQKIYNKPLLIQEL
ncbi:MAG: response regulator [Chitinispirillaceae bacterium]|nr:response regulator [Chitinispirillaceae bacterium]